MIPPELTMDQAALDRLKRFGGGKLLREMIALFLVAAPERMTAAGNAAAAGEAAPAELALHSLKSSSAQLGAPRMQQLSAQGEQLARNGALDEVARVVADLETEFVQVKAWLTRVRDEDIPT